MLGLNPASTMPNYTLGINAGAQQPTYRPGMANGGQNGSSQYSMINTRIPNPQSNDYDGPRGMDQVWQVVDDKNQFGDAAGASEEGYYAQQANRKQAGAEDDNSSIDDGQDSENEVNQEYYVSKKQRNDSFSADDPEEDGDDFFSKSRDNKNQTEGQANQGLAVDESGFAVLPANHKSNLKSSGKDKKSRKDSDAESNKPVVLTFVDMSKLKYLSRSMTSNNDRLSRKKQAVELPKNTNVSIAEAVNEEDSEGESPMLKNVAEDVGEQQKKKASTPQELALEVLNEIIDIVLEAEREAKTLESSEIVSNALLQ